MVPPAFGARLRELRTAAKLSQKQLAEASGQPQKSISNWEQGRSEPGWFAVIALAKALGVSTDAFLTPPTSDDTPGRGRPRKAEEPDARAALAC